MTVAFTKADLNMDAVELYRRVVGAALLVCLLLLSGCNAYQDPALSIDGGCAPASSPFLASAPNVNGRITYCEGGDGWIGTAESHPYPKGTRNVQVMLAGYPGTANITLYAIASNGQAAIIPVLQQPGDRWQRFVLEIPAEISKADYRLRLEDQSKASFGWAGIGASTSSPTIASVKGMLPILVAALFGNFWLIAVSLCVPNVGQHARERILQGLLVGGCAWLLIFFGYVLSAKLGSILSLLILIAPFPLALIAGRQRHTSLREVAGMQNALLPVLMLMCFVLWIGLFPFHWDGHPGGDAANRWPPRLELDAWLPLLFGDMLKHGTLVVPMVGDWLSSDRPPLQVGLYLLASKLPLHNKDLIYQGISSWAQALVLLPIWALLARFMDKRAQAISLCIIGISALMLLNTLYVWPKLLAATFCLIYYISMFPADLDQRRWGQAGLGAAMALLSHGGALFFLVGASALHLAWYRRQSLATLIKAGVLASVIYMPWIAYQRLVDPPGDRLIKWHFAGKIPVSSESALHAITSAYSQITFATWLSTRMENVATVVKGTFSGLAHALWIVAQHDPSTISQFISDDFFHLFHSMWFTSPLLLIPCLVFLYMRQRRQADPAVKGLLQASAATALSLIFWIVSIFDGGTTTVHIGAYASVLMLHIVVLAAAWRTSPPLFYAICAANATVSLSVYAFNRNFLPGLQPAYLLGSILTCCAFVFSVFRSMESTQSRPAADLVANQ